VTTLQKAMLRPTLFSHRKLEVHSALTWGECPNLKVTMARSQAGP
jgi:hypothetical protein